MEERVYKRRLNNVDELVTGHFGIKTLWETSAPISRQFDTSAVIEEKPGHWSRPIVLTQDNSDETQLHR